MTKIETMLALAKTNNLPAIWKSKVTGNDLAAEVGELSEFDRRNIEVFDKYRAGNGTVKFFDAVKALTRLAPKAEPKALTPLLRANTLGNKLMSHSLVQKQRQRLQMLAHRYEELTGASSLGVSPEEQLAEIKEIEATLFKRSRRAA